MNPQRYAFCFTFGLVSPLLAAAAAARMHFSQPSSHDRFLIIGRCWHFHFLNRRCAKRIDFIAAFLRCVFPLSLSLRPFFRLRSAPDTINIGFSRPASPAIIIIIITALYSLLLNKFIFNSSPFTGSDRFILLRPKLNSYVRAIRPGAI